jgi:transposase InsO family protein
MSRGIADTEPGRACSGVMTGTVPSMDVRMVAAISGQLLELNVAELCRARGISRQTFYKYRRRFAEVGMGGLEPMSRAAHRFPRRTPLEVEEAIVELRKELTDEGLDAGAGTIQFHLGRRGSVNPVPAEATIWRILDRRGFITHQTHKRPKASLRRFEAAAPNERWQGDVTEWVVANHAETVEIINYLDDHSRLWTRGLAVEVATVETTWQAFEQGAERWGMPAGFLSDNGLVFSGRLHGVEVAFEAHLRAAGIVQVTSSPGHPQTCGKVERFQQTLKKWLRKQPLAANLAELQAQLDTFGDYYNFQRPHRGIGRIVPFERWQATPPMTSLDIPLPARQRSTHTVVEANGIVRVRPWRIHVGVTHRGQPAHVLLDDTHAAVFINHELVRCLELDPSRSYQPSGLPPGRHS